MGNTNTEGEGMAEMVQRNIMGRTLVLPVYPRGWDINPTRADSIDDKMQLQYAHVCAYRWKHIEIRQLGP